MQDAAPGKDNAPKSPEELQTSLRRAYFLIPLNLFYDIESFALEPNGITKFADGLFDREARAGELVPLLEKKFSEMIAQAATTDTFKEMIKLPLGRIIIQGRDAEKGDPQGLPETEWGRAVYRALGLNQDSKTGIFTKEGAHRGEAALFVWYFKQWGEAMSELRAANKDIRDPEVLKENHLLSHLPESPTLDKLPKILADWRQEITDHYGN